MQKRERTAVVTLVITLLLAASSHGVTFTVTKTADTNDGSCDADCSLREAIVAANASATDDVIEFGSPVFASPQMITLALGELIVANNGSLTINGTGVNQLTISGNDQSRVIFINSDAMAIIDGVTIRDGIAVSNDTTLNGMGGGILALGDLTLTNSAVSDNDGATSGSTGGGIHIAFQRTATIRNSTISGNISTEGGGIYNLGTLSVSHSTIARNTGTSRGGGLLNGNTAALTNSTISANRSNNSGGIHSLRNLDLDSVTVIENNRWGIVISGTTTLTNTIVARNSPISPDNADVLGRIAATSSFNLIGNGYRMTGISNGTNGNQVGPRENPIDPMLGPLRDNGGATETHAPFGDSPAIDRGNSSLTEDQRGRPRPVDLNEAKFPNATGGNGADIGAVELQSDPPPAPAAQLTVTKIADTDDGICDADCSLREAIAAANLTEIDNAIGFASPLFDSPQTITLVFGELTIENNGAVTINGPGANLLTISGNNSSRVVYISQNANLTMTNLAIKDGNGAGSARFAPDSGGGIYNDLGTLALVNAVVSNNSAFSGGGIYQAGPVTLTNSTISNNTAQEEGGGISNYLGSSASHSLILIRSEIINNAAASGGGIANTGPLTIDSSTISHNTATSGGGGILNRAFGVSNATFRGTIDAINTTISNNSGGSSGGGILQTTGTVNLINSTISDNSATSGGGVSLPSESTYTVGGDISVILNLKNSIIANSTGGDCASIGTINAEFSLIEDGLACVNGTNSNNLTGDPNLGPLQNNCGPTETHAPLLGSILIDSGNNALVPDGITADQRGAERIFDGDNNGSATIDRGAVEAFAPVTGNCGGLLNISTRLRVLTGENALIGGFIVTGTEQKRVLIRAIGPSLTGAGVEGALDDTTLELFAEGESLAFNDNWRDTQESEIAGTTIPPGNELESAIVRTLEPGAYTAVVRGKNDTTGIALIEAYDLAQGAQSTLANISSRGRVETGENVIIGGFIVSGGARVVIRAIGPSLTATGVAEALQDPMLQLVDANGSEIRANDNWRTDQQAEIEAIGIQPSDDRESALIATLAAGNYTAVVRGAADGTGVGLVEIYNLP